MVDYQGNSRKLHPSNKEEKPKKVIVKVVQGDVIQIPVPMARRFKNVFFGGTFNTAIKYVTAEVLLPALRTMIVDTGRTTLERVVFGDSYRRQQRPPEYRPYTSYSSYSSPYRSGPSPAIPATSRYEETRTVRPVRRDINQLVLVHREEAEAVVETMLDIIEKYDAVSVADLNEMVGIQTTPIDNKWGWTDLRGAEVRQVREGYLIEIPAPEPLG